MDNKQHNQAPPTETPSAGGPSAGPAFTKAAPDQGFGDRPSRTLRRTMQGRMVAGVCSGAGDFLGVDANVVRLLLGVFTVFGGSGIALYALGWLLIPEEGRDTSIVQDLIDRNRDNPAVQDVMTRTREVFDKSMSPR